jgi:hypothetical protein
MKARILIATVVGALSVAASPAYAGVVLQDGGAPVAGVHRIPTAILRHHSVKSPWAAPNRDQVSRDAI